MWKIFAENIILQNNTIYLFSLQKIQETMFKNNIVTINKTKISLCMHYNIKIY